MINKLKPKSEFSRNVLTLMTGTTIAQAIPIAISPILTRLYTPEDFGVFALFFAISSIFGSIANGRYELAIMLPKKDEDAINIFALGVIITSIVSLTLLLIIIVFHGYILELLNNKDIGIWLYFIPLVVFFSGIFNLLNYYNNRKKQYKDIANATIIKSIALAIIQLSIGFIKSGASGLISGQIVSQFFANMKLFKNIIKDKILISKINKEQIISLAKRYKDFPKFSLLTVLSNRLSRQIINLAIPMLFNISTLGYISLIQRVLSIPLSLIGTAIGKVLFQEAVLEKQSTGKATRTFNNTAKKLVLISFPIFIFLFFYIKELVEFAFGKNWSIAGDYARILLPLYFVNFISSPLDEIINVFEKQKILLIMNLMLLTASIITLSIVKIYSIKFTVFLYFYTYSLLIIYCIFIYYSYKVAKGKEK